MFADELGEISDQFTASPRGKAASLFVFDHADTISSSRTASSSDLGQRAASMNGSPRHSPSVATHSAAALASSGSARA